MQLMSFKRDSDSSIHQYLIHKCVSDCEECLRLSGAVDRLFKKVHHLLAKEMHLKISE
jgi:hypothetical protein